MSPKVSDGSKYTASAMAHANYFSERGCIISLCNCWNIFLLSLLIVCISVSNNSEAYALSFGGYCARCETHHVLPTTDEAKRAALDLRERMIQSGRIDIDELPPAQRTSLLSSSSSSQKGNDDDNEDKSYCSDVDLDPLLATERLYERRGKMFGVLICKLPQANSTILNAATSGTDPNKIPNLPQGILRNGDTIVLKGYAGKLGNQWNLPGWAPLVGKVPESIPKLNQLSGRVTELFEEIDTLSQKEVEMGSVSQKIKELTKERSKISTLCIQELRRHQVLNNFRGIRMPITDAFVKGPTKLPGGTGDCAAPKLIAWAIELGLEPIGICEIFIGATGGMSTTKGDGKFYDACEPRCQQIAGHMLCGLELHREKSQI